jgi:predicted regulator of Ras-like GTPase activity (Roadblock/LC7/MglB family)
MIEPATVPASSGDYQLNLTTESAKRFREAMRSFLDETGCSLGAIIERSGAVIVSEQRPPGNGTKLPRPDSIGALAAGLFASTQMLAGQIGESDSPEVICHGRELHLFVAPLTEEFALLAVFPNRVAVGLIRLQAKKVAAGIMADLRQIIRNVTTLAPSSGSPSPEERENPFLRYN